MRRAWPRPAQASLFSSQRSAGQSAAVCASTDSSVLLGLVGIIMGHLGLSAVPVFESQQDKAAEESHGGP